jgi:hypothetical protein
MLRVLLASFALVALSVAAQAEALRPLAAEEPDPVAEARAAAVEAYLAGGVPLERIETGERVAAPAGGGVFGWLSVRLQVWYPALEGDLRSGGDSLDLDELGLDENEIALLPEIHISLGSVGIRLDGFMFETDGEENVDHTFTFAGIDFDVNERVRSTLELSNVRVLSTLRVAGGDVFELHIQGGVSVFFFDGRLEGDSSGTATESAIVPIPVLGILARAKIGPVLLELDVTGLVIDYGEIRGTTFDARFSVGYTFLKVVAVRAGFRIVTIDGEAEDIDIDARLSGFFVGASVQF